MNIGEKNNTSANNTNNDGSTLRILTNSNFSTEELKKIDVNVTRSNLPMTYLW